MFDQIQKLARVKQAMEEAKAGLKDHYVDVQNESGTIRITLSADRFIKNLEIDPEYLQTQDPVSLQEELTETLNQGINAATKKGSEVIREGVKDHIPNIPGLNPEDLGINL